MARLCEWEDICNLQPSIGREDLWCWRRWQGKNVTFYSYFFQDCTMLVLLLMIRSWTRICILWLWFVYKLVSFEYSRNILVHWAIDVSHTADLYQSSLTFSKLNHPFWMYPSFSLSSTHTHTLLHNMNLKQPLMVQHLTHPHTFISGVFPK